MSQLKESTDATHVQFMRAALDEAYKSVPVPGAFCVGCVFVDEGDGDAPGTVVSTGYSRELPGNTHAEANALVKVKDGVALVQRCAVYTTMEPCSVRLSGLPPCADALIEAKVRRCFIGVKEPDDFVDCVGARKLLDAGIAVVWVRGLEDECLAAARRS